VTTSAQRLERGAAASVVAGLAGLCGVVLLRDPRHHVIFPPCPFHLATGGWCPGCGATRASALLLRGHVLEALHYNALWVLLSPFAAYQLVMWALGTFGVRWARPLPVPTRAAQAILVAIAVFFVVRNLPFGPLHVLDPPAAS
jgi:hypothetical protein